MYIRGPSGCNMSLLTNSWIPATWNVSVKPNYVQSSSDSVTSVQSLNGNHLFKWNEPNRFIWELHKGGRLNCLPNSQVAENNHFLHSTPFLFAEAHTEFRFSVIPTCNTFWDWLYFHNKDDFSPRLIRHLIFPSSVSPFILAAQFVWLQFPSFVCETPTELIKAERIEGWKILSNAQ